MFMIPTASSSSCDRLRCRNFSACQPVLIGRLGCSASFQVIRLRYSIRKHSAGLWPLGPSSNSREGVPLQQSQLYLAVSQTEDPTGDYFIYVLNTTLANNPDRGGPRIPDFPHFAVDHYGLYISINEFGINPDGSFDGFIDAAILAISKKALINGGGGTVSRLSYASRCHSHPALSSRFFPLIRHRVVAHS